VFMYAWAQFNGVSTKQSRSLREINLSYFGPTSVLLPSGSVVASA